MDSRSGLEVGMVLVTALVLSTNLSMKAQVSWNQRAPLTAPASRPGAAFAQDVLRGRSVIFAGQSPTGNYADTWEWDGSTWTQRFPAHVPGARRRPAMTYDSARGVCVLFGGYSGSFDYADTWEWDGTDWTLRTPTVSPGGRDTFAMAYDTLRGVVVLYGGSAGVLIGDTWEYDGTTWTRRSPTTTPGPRESHAMAYDSVRHVVVLFGGYTGGGTLLNDTWEWDGVQWMLRAAATKPSPRSEPAMVFDAARGVAVMCGGYSGSALLGDTWEWDGTTWTQRTPGTALTARRSHAFVYQPARRLCMVFSGVVSPDANDTWEYGPTDMADFVTYGSGCAGSNGIPLLGSNDLGPFVGDVFTTTVTDLPPDPSTVVVALLGFLDTNWGSVVLPADLGVLGMFGCTLYNDVGWANPLPLQAGVATFDLTIPSMPDLVGLTFFEQAMVTDPSINPAGWIMSNPARGRIGAR